MISHIKSRNRRKRSLLPLASPLLFYLGTCSALTLVQISPTRRLKKPRHEKRRRRVLRSGEQNFHGGAFTLFASALEERTACNESSVTSIYFAERIYPNSDQESITQDSLSLQNQTYSQTGVTVESSDLERPQSASGSEFLKLPRLPTESFVSNLDKARSTLFNSLSTQNKAEPSSETDISEYSSDETVETPSLRRLWRRRYARTLEEGIRRERATELSDLLNKAQIDAKRQGPRRYVARTLMGLMNALAEEMEDLDIDFTAQPKSPFWRKEVKEIRINFSRLGFKPIRMGGSDKYDRNGDAVIKELAPLEDQKLSLVDSADEAFDRIDKDKSGTLDSTEIAEVLSSISGLETDKDSIEELASDLVDLYDDNSDGVVDREEYQQMVEDMARLRPSIDEDSTTSPLIRVKASVQSISRGISKKAAQVAAVASRSSSEDTDDFDPNEREMGSILLSDLNLDLRRLLFGGLPIIKRVTPGGPLILEPFTATIRGSFTREDVMDSFLLDSGLRLLVARVIRLRVRSFRDVVDGAYFFGRQWKMASKSAPVVQVLELSNVEFVNDKMILTGRARIRTSPEAPIVTNTFKVRTKIGTQNNGQSIGLVEPELAFVFECPRTFENGLGTACEALGLPKPTRPKPIYSFFPIYSPFKVNENTGFNMGEDNQLRKIFVKDGKLRFEMRAVLRPGRFLGNHYLAFTVPNRTFIITMDRVREGIRVARQNKKIAAREKQLLDDAPEISKRDLSARRIFKSVRNFAGRRRFLSSIKQPKPRSFFARFVEGYTLVERDSEATNEQLTYEISDWFGRQGETGNITTSTVETKEEKDYIA